MIEETKRNEQNPANHKFHLPLIKLRNSIKYYIWS